MDLEVHYRGFVIAPVKTEESWNGVIRRLGGEEFSADGTTKTSIETMNCPDIHTAVGTAKLAVDGIMRSGGKRLPRK